MKKIIVLSLLMVCFSTVYSQVESELEKYKREQDEAMKAMQQQNNELLSSLEKELYKGKA